MISNLFKRRTNEDESLDSKLVFAALFMFIVPILLALYLIFIALSNRSMASNLGYIRLILFWMVVSGVFGYILIKRTIRSILSLTLKAKNIAEGQLGEKIEVRRGTELQDLATAFNRITSELEKKVKELEYSRSLTRELFQKIGHAITSSQKIDALLLLITQSMRKVLGAESSFIALYSALDSKLYLRAYSGPQKEMAENMPLPDDSGVIGLVVRDKKPMIIRKVKGETVNRMIPGEEKFKYNTILCVPVTEKNRLKGVIGVTDLADTERIDTDDMYLMESMAGQIATSVENFELNRDIEDTYYSTLLALARVVEAKDPYSAGHLERVSEYVGAIADRLNLSPDAKKVLLGGAVLHDLGKVGIRDDILKKEGTLTKEEYDTMKQHTVIGENILKPLQSMSKLSELVRHHHELYDGTGYPDGLRGEEIPLSSRILTIADIYDALTTKRPYKNAMTKDAAIKVLRSYEGSKLDSKLTELFISILNEAGNKEAESQNDITEGDK